MARVFKPMVLFLIWLIAALISAAFMIGCDSQEEAVQIVTRGDSIPVDSAKVKPEMDKLFSFTFKARGFSHHQFINPVVIKTYPQDAGAIFVNGFNGIVTQSVRVIGVISVTKKVGVFFFGITRDQFVQTSTVGTNPDHTDSIFVKAPHIVMPHAVGII